MIRVSFFLLIAFFLLQCETAKEPIDLSAVSSDEDVMIVIDTDYGTMEALLYDLTPKHKSNFLKLVSEGFYNDLLFHRVIEGFMLQGGDPDSKNASKEAALGRGDPGYTIPAEFNDKLFHKKGAIAAARLGDQNNPEKVSNGSQFFIVQGKQYQEEELLALLVDYRKLYAYFDSAMRSEHFDNMKSSFIAVQTEGDREEIRKFIAASKDTLETFFSVELDKTIPASRMTVYKELGGYPTLDGAYTVFGEVVKGLEVIDIITAKETGIGDRPKEDIKMQISLKVMKRDEIKQKYDFEYPSK
ncbi:MAG: peptidylprolyl isomerase [Bacteroidota bacterium]